MFDICATKIYFVKRNTLMAVNVSLVVNHTVAIHFVRLDIFVCQS